MFITAGVMPATSAASNGSIHHQQRRRTQGSSHTAGGWRKRSSSMFSSIVSSTSSMLSLRSNSICSNRNKSTLTNVGAVVSNKKSRITSNSSNHEDTSTSTSATYNVKKPIYIRRCMHACSECFDHGFVCPACLRQQDDESYGY